MKTLLLSCVSRLALTRASRSGESVDLLQLGQMAVQKVFTANTVTEDLLQGVKTEVLNMANVPEAARGHLTTIETLLTEKVLPSLITENAGDKERHGEQYGLFATYASDHNDNIALLSASEAASNSARGNHISCRGLEGGLHGAKELCDGQEVTSRSNYQTARNNFKVSGSGLGIHGDELCDASSSTDAWIGSTLGEFDSYAGLFDTAAMNYRLYVNKTAECTGRTTALNNKKTACDGLQETYEDKACVYAVEFKEEQSAYKLKYDTHLEGYQSERSGWTAASANRQKQCTLTKTVICYIKELRDKNEEAELTSAIAACDAAEHETACGEYGFTPNAAPDMQDLAPLPKVCDDVDFVYYLENEPSGTSLAECNSCLALHAPPKITTEAPIIEPLPRCTLDLSKIEAAVKGPALKAGSAAMVFDGKCPAQASSWVGPMSCAWTSTDTSVEIDLGGTMCFDGVAFQGDNPDIYMVWVDGVQLYEEAAVNASGGNNWTPTASTSGETCSTALADVPELCGQVVSVTAKGGDLHFAVAEVLLRGKPNSAVPKVSCRD